VALEGKTILVTAFWSLEIANPVLAGERKKRLRQPEIRLRCLLPGTLDPQQRTAGHVGRQAGKGRKIGLRAMLTRSVGAARSYKPLF